MKHCKYCNRDLPEEMFCYSPTTKDRLQTKCKKCQAEYNKRRKKIKENIDPEKKENERMKRIREWRDLADRL